MQISPGGQRLARASSALSALYAANASAVDAVPTIGLARFAQTGLSLAGVVALIFGLAYLARRFQRTPTGSGLLKVIDGLTLGTRERILLIEADGERVVVAVVAGRIDTLHVLGRRLESSTSFAANLEAQTARTKVQA